MNVLLLLSWLWLLPVMASDLYYLKPDSVDVSLIPPAPILDSPEDQMDLARVLSIQDRRTEAECKRASIEAEGYATSFFGAPYGPLTTEEAEKLVQFQERLFQEIKFFSRKMKLEYSRQRPFLRDERVIPCIPLHHSNSYPSGHAAISFVAGRTFALLYPEKQEKFYERSREIAQGRVNGGVHYPVDIEAGTLLGNLVFEALMKEEKFLQDVRDLSL